MIEATSRPSAEDIPLIMAHARAHATVSKSMASVVYGHTHRKDEAHLVSMSGKDYRSFCPGWLGNKNSYAFDYVKNHHQWTTGFAVVYALKNGKDRHSCDASLCHRYLYE